MMKIGFSSLACPGWDLETIVANASEMGFDGVELQGLQDELELPLVPELTSQPERVRQIFQRSSVELVCLGIPATLSSHRGQVVARQKAVVTSVIELAAKLGCPYVRLDVGKVQRWDNRRAAQSRIAEALISLVPVACHFGVTLLVENGGDFPGSQELWFLIDAVGHPAVQCCWNQCQAMTIGERPTKSIPCLGSKIGLVHLCDAEFDEHGTLLEYKPLGEGNVEVARQIELLKGIVYDRYLVFESPETRPESLPAPEDVLGKAAKTLRERIDEQQSILSAYKGDKRAPPMASRVTVPGTH
ncbi:MAG: sugar phosphate isomerase/epimerase [Phycisphaerales bacterium]|nr:MAG: sugar phosphate isomerase/epimerase [Phycisphaerales bacterium]